jgi:hypothetical protein
MYWRDHSPPHFHARYAGEQIAIDIHTLKILQGKMSRRAPMLVLEWAQEHRANLWRVGNYVKQCSHQRKSRRFCSPTYTDWRDVLRCDGRRSVGRHRLRVRFADGLEGEVEMPGELDLAPDAMHDEIEKSGVWKL